MAHLNIEIKARCADREKLHTILMEAGADFRGIDHQVDTYFEVPKGRLKLREGNIERSLIHYQRPDQEGPKGSEVNLFRMESMDAAPLKAALAGALNLKVVVDKKRGIYFIDNVKFHLDEVDGLGSFAEIEAIDADGTIGEARLREQCQQYMSLLDIREEDLLSFSYSDLLMETRLP